MKTLVTGADGFLGSNVVRELLERSIEVRALIQPGRSVHTLEGLDIEFVYGDLEDTALLKREVKGCSAIIHCAALAAMWPTHDPCFNEVNVVGTEHIIEAALDNDVERFVHISSASVYAHGSRAMPGNERRMLNFQDINFDYVRSKYRAQELTQEAFRRDNLPAIIANPTFMIGPHDAKPSSGAMILAFVNGKLPGYTTGGRNFVSVQDASKAICNALSMGTLGESYILGNENLTYESFFEKVAQVTGLPPLRREIKAPFAKLFGMT